MHLADEGIDVDHQPLAAGTGAGRPHALQGQIEHPVELTDMPEAECAQKGAERRGRHHPVSEHKPRAARTQDVHLIDAVRPGEHPVHEREHLAPRQRRARHALSQMNRVIDQLLELEPASE